MANIDTGSISGVSGAENLKAGGGLNSVRRVMTGSNGGSNAAPSHQPALSKTAGLDFSAASAPSTGAGNNTIWGAYGNWTHECVGPLMH